MTLRDDELLREIGAALDVVPSAEFARGVGRRIARRRALWRASGVGVIAAAGVMAMVWTTPKATTPRPSPPVATTMVATTPRSADEPAPVVVPGAVGARPAPRRAPTVTVERAAPWDEVGVMLVVTNQMELLQQMWAPMGGARVDRSADVELPGLIPGVVVVEPVTVEPVVIATGGREQGGSVQTIRRALTGPESR